MSDQIETDHTSKSHNILSDEEANRRWRTFCEGGGPSSLDAFGCLYDAYLPDVFRYCRFLLRDENRASELAQELFVRLLQLKKKPTIRSSAKGLFLRMAHNLCATELAKPRLRLEPGQPLHDSPDRDLQHNEEIAALQECMSHLPEPDRTMLVLRCGEGLTYRDIREILGLQFAWQTFTRRIAKALNNLRRCLEKKSIF